MSACADKESTRCQESSDNSNGAIEGIWVGIAVGAWVALLVIVWFIRTCTNGSRRRRALKTFGCLKKKANASPKGYSDVRTSSHASDRGSVYYIPSPPPTYEEILMRPSRYMVQSAAYGLYHQCGPGGHQVRLTLPCSSCLPNRYRNRSSRSSLSMLSISLATIEEEDRCDTSQPPSPTCCNGDTKQTRAVNDVGRYNSRSPGLTFKIDYDDTSVGVADVQPQTITLDSSNNVTNTNSKIDISDTNTHNAINKSIFRYDHREKRASPGDNSDQKQHQRLIIT